MEGAESGRLQRHSAAPVSDALQQLLIAELLADLLQLRPRASPLKVKQKSNNLAGLQLADLVAHPGRNEILNENGHSMIIAPFAAKAIATLQGKYDQRGGRVFGKKML